jgi:hypothetical protein
MMKCRECHAELDEPLKYLAYKADGKPVYWKVCEPCIKKRWLAYKATAKDETKS